MTRQWFGEWPHNKVKRILIRGSRKKDCFWTSRSHIQYISVSGARVTVPAVENVLEQLSHRTVCDDTPWWTRWCLSIGHNRNNERHTDTLIRTKHWAKRASTNCCLLWDHCVIFNTRTQTHMRLRTHSDSLTCANHWAKHRAKHITRDAANVETVSCWIATETLCCMRRKTKVCSSVCQGTPCITCATSNTTLLNFVILNHLSLTIHETSLLA